MAMVIHDWVTGNPNLEEDLKLMRLKAETLFARAADISTEVRNEELHPGKKRKREVDNWMKNAQELKIRMDCIEEEAEQGGLFSYKRLRNQIIKITEEIEELLEHASFRNGLTIHDLASSSLPLPTKKMEGRIFHKNLTMISSWLMNDEVSSIGVYGVGGVGKTTLAKHIYNHLHRDFKASMEVYWVSVSHEFTVHILQQKIAKALGSNQLLEEEDDETIRASMIEQALKKKMKKIVFFLDNLWQPISVDKLGLPLGVSHCKLLFTTRLSDVCRKMACQKSVKVEPLSEEESLELFVGLIGNMEDLSTEAKDIAALVCKECDGLPLGIDVIAASMRAEFDIHEWRNTLEELRECTRIHDSMEKEVFPVLQLSYSRLNDSDLQNCFLSCSLYPEDWEISRDKLVNFWILDGMFDEIRSRQSQLDKGYSTVNRLIKASLLEATDSEGVRMHDLVRDMAINILRQNCQFMIKAGVQLREVPDDREWMSSLQKVSLIGNLITEIHSGTSPRCPNLSTLLLQNNPLMFIPDTFFRHLVGLKVINLTETRIEMLPNCISELVNLRALVLSSCSRLKYIPSIEKLEKLKHLDLSWCSSIKVLPQGIGSIANLEFLGLRGTYKLSTSFSDIVSGVRHLQCLELGCGVKGIHAKELVKLKHLERLTGCQMSDVNDFNSYARCRHLGQLSSYEIAVGHRDQEHVFSCEFDRTVMIQCYSFGGSHGERPILPLNAQELQISNCDFRTKKTLVDALPSLLELTRLRRIDILQSQGIEFILGSTSELKSLEQLILWNLPNLQMLVKEGVHPVPGTFTALKKLKIECCSGISKLFLPHNGRLSYLQNLQEMDIDRCQELEEIVAAGSIQDSGTILELPKLRILRLLNLPKLTRIYNRELLHCDSIEEITVLRCPRLTNFPVCVPTPSPTLREIIAEEQWWESIEWSHRNSKEVIQPYVVFCNSSVTATNVEPQKVEQWEMFLEDTRCLSGQFVCTSR